ncbi:MAG: glycoside hydrolase family 32 protein [Bacteroidales bacterium]|nr:glycoside hydrolase family 32 protein [Bacteroidales bacterium]
MLRIIFNTIFILSACNLMTGQTTSQSFEYRSIDKRFVHLPVKTGAAKTWMIVNIDEKMQHEFEIELAPAEPDFFVTLEVGKWKGKRLNLTAETVAFGSEWKSRIRLSDEMSDEDLVYREEYRPQFHFSPRRGWTNDPNGLVYYKGIYHLFFQHNPYGTSWGNMTWGHAVSNDLLHWTERPDAVLPDKNGVVFSGSAVVDWKNTSGLQKKPVRDNSGNIENPPLVAFYTSTGANRGKGHSAQSMVYSLDEGDTWLKYPRNPVIPHIVGGNRDPKVFWYEEKKNTTGKQGKWIMALYMDKEDYALFSSDNLIRWNKICDIKDMGCSECPDIFELPVDGDKNNTRWVFWGGNGKYLIGTFDGITFKKEGGPFDAKHGGNDYAAQTYSDIPTSDGRRIMFSWMQGGQYPGMPFNQQFTVPRNLTLRETPRGIRLFIEPVKELESLRVSNPVALSVKFNGKDIPVNIPDLKGELLDIQLLFNLRNSESRDTSKTINIEIFGQTISYRKNINTIELEGIKAPLIPMDGKIIIRLITDRTSIEMFANDGIVQIAKCFVNSRKSPAGLAISGNQELEDFEATVYNLRSVWKR